MIEYETLRLRELVEHYMDCRSGRTSAVSVAAVKRAVTTIMPQCPLQTYDLIDLIAASAVSRGFEVNFDLEVHTLAAA